MIAEFLALALALGGLNATLSYVFWVAPLPKKWKIIAQQLYSDAVVINLLVFSISLVQTAVTGISSLLSISISGPMNLSTSFSAIMLQLGTLLTGILATSIVSSVSGIEVLTRILGLVGQAIAADMILWSIVYLAITLILEYWTLLYSIGILLYSIPFRLARKAGSTIMASACVLAACLPLLPDFALMAEWAVGFQPVLENLLTTINQFQTNPLTILNMPQYTFLFDSLAQILAGMIIALVIFPLIYIWILSKIVRRLGELIGGYERELDLARWITP